MTGLIRCTLEVAAVLASGVLCGLLAIAQGFINALTGMDHGFEWVFGGWLLYGAYGILAGLLAVVALESFVRLQSVATHQRLAWGMALGALVLGAGIALLLPRSNADGLVTHGFPFYWMARVGGTVVGLLLPPVLLNLLLASFIGFLVGVEACLLSIAVNEVREDGSRTS